MLEGERAFLSQEGYKGPQIPNLNTDCPGAGGDWPLRPLLAGAHYIRHQRQGSTSHRLRWTCLHSWGNWPTQPPAAGSGKNLTPVSHWSPRPPLSFCRGHVHMGRWPGTRKRALHARAQAAATWVGGRGFQGASGQAPRVLTTVTSPAHSDSTQGPSQTKKLPN